MRKSTFLVSMAIAVALGSVCTTAVAATSSINPILAANSEAGIFLSRTQSNYSENIVSQYGSDTEHGAIGGFGIKVSDNFNAFGVNNWYASLSYRRTSGQTQYEDGLSFESAGHNTNNISAKFGKTFFMANDMAVTPYLFGGYRSWNRVVPNGVANPENYSNGYIGMGGMFQYAVDPRLVLSANAGIGDVIGGSINGDTQMLSQEYDGYLYPNSFNASLASRPYGTVGAGADYRVTRNLHLFTNLQYTEFQYGGSPTYVFQGSGPLQGYYGTLREPSSQTSNFTMDLGVAYSWG